MQRSHRSATANYLQVANVPLADGRFFTETDDRHRRDVAVIAADVVERFFLNEDPLGKTILVDGHAFEIVGTTEKFKGFIGDNPDDRDIFIPYSTYKKYYADAKDNFLNILAREGMVPQAIDEVTGVLRRRRHVKPSDPDNFGIATAESLISQFHQIIGTVALVTVVMSPALFSTCVPPAVVTFTSPTRPSGSGSRTTVCRTAQATRAIASTASSRQRALSIIQGIDAPHISFLYFPGMIGN